MIAEYFRKKVREDQLKLIRVNRELISEISPVVKYASEIKKEEWAITLASEIPEVLEELKRMEFLLTVSGELDDQDNSDLLDINKSFQHLAKSARRGAERAAKAGPFSENSPYATPQSNPSAQLENRIPKAKKFLETFIAISLAFLALAFLGSGGATIFHIVVAILAATLAGAFSMLMPTNIRFLYIAGGFVSVLLFSIVVSLVGRLLSA